MTRAELNQALHGIAVYNPDLLSREELKRYFVGRLPLLDRIVADLKRERPGSIGQHRLFLGQRGMGKTSLLRRIAIAVEEDLELNAIWLPLTFPEEQYNIADLADLWLNCLDAVGDALERRGLNDAADALDARIQALDDASPNTVRDVLLDQAHQLNRRLLLLVDNIDLILDRLREHHWVLREALQSCPELVVFGASARAIEASYKYDAAFYDFFRIDELKGLTEAELKATLIRLAEVGNTPAVTELVEQDPARIRTLHLLTGGNPRTTVLLYGVLAQGPAGDVRSDLEGLLDRVTPLYKARFEDLPERGQQLVDALALYWDPASARQLADRLGWDVNLVSAQLDRLQTQGIVEKTEPYKAKRTLFQVAERFFNIWYLMRASRRVRRRLTWLVRFLRMWLSARELACGSAPGSWMPMPGTSSRAGVRPPAMPNTAWPWPNASRMRRCAGRWRTRGSAHCWMTARRAVDSASCWTCAARMQSWPRRPSGCGCWPRVGSRSPRRWTPSMSTSTDRPSCFSFSAALHCCCLRNRRLRKMLGA